MDCPTLQAVGPQATNQAVKSIAIARTFLKQSESIDSTRLFNTQLWVMHLSHSTPSAQFACSQRLFTSMMVTPDCCCRSTPNPPPPHVSTVVFCTSVLATTTHGHIVSIVRWQETACACVCVLCAREPCIPVRVPQQIRKKARRATGEGEAQQLKAASQTDAKVLAGAVSS